VTGKRRWKDIPEVATVAEQGLPDFEVISWSGLAAPARTPQPIIQRLHGEIEKAISIAERPQQAGSGRQRSARDEPRRDARPRRSASQDVERGRARSQDRARLSISFVGARHASPKARCVW
jgi:Tripartite tricarboxylate transporter family receptor